MEDIRKRLRRYSVFERHSKVSVEDFAKPMEEDMSVKEFVLALPKILAGDTLLKIAKYIKESPTSSSKVLMMGAHPIKVGLSPLIIQCVERGIFNHVAGNGAVAVHDVEIAMMGATSEDVENSIDEGLFGMGKETALFINGALKDGLKKGWGFGESVGRKIIMEGLKYKELSILSSCVKRSIPITIHVAIGTDVVHVHPECSGAETGEATYKDFLKFVESLKRIEGGFVINLGSVVIMPEVFLKAISMLRNIGIVTKNFMTVNMDFTKLYRPSKNVLERPGGTSYELIGHHEINLPLLVATIMNL